MQLFSYLFWPRNAKVPYDNPKVQLLLLICGGLILLSLVFRFWRRWMSNESLRKLSRSWASAAFWFGIVGLLLVIARTEDITFVAMRFWWVVWAGALALYLWFQMKQLRTRYIVRIPTAATNDPRAKYLPSKKKR